MATREEIDAVKTKVTIPDYVQKVIVPAMPWYFNDYPADFVGRPYIKCPLHGEDTPSFKYYEETNSFYCFGCGAGGDVIRLHRLFMEKMSNSSVSYDEAVTFLRDTFIDKVTSAAPVIQTSKVQKALPRGRVPRVEQSDSELIRFNRLYTQYDQQLQMDSGIPENLKIEMYKVIDDCQRCVKDNLVTASDAIKYLKESFQEVILNKL